MTAARRNSTLFKSMPYLRSAQARSIGFYIASWYTASLVTLFMNKWFMLKEGINGNPQTLALAQMVFSCATGAIKNFSDSKGGLELRSVELSARRTAPVFGLAVKSLPKAQ